MKIRYVVYGLVRTGGYLTRMIDAFFFLQLSLVRRQKRGPISVARLCLCPVRCVSMADKDRFLKVFQVCLRPVPNNLYFFLLRFKKRTQKVFF